MKSLISFLKVLSIILIMSEFAKVESKFILKFKQPQSCPKNTNFFFDDMKIWRKAGLNLKTIH
jgi:hypothetical protein